MLKLVECVPNFSEGRDMSIIKNITNEIDSVDGVELLDVDPGADTNRTVVTMIGTPEAVKEAAFLVVKKASELIDMSKHTGTHPRMGATDVCPFVPVSGVTMEDCVQIAHEVGKRIGDELLIPIYMYENAAKIEERKNLANARKGEYEALKDRIPTEEGKPDYGPAVFNAKTGATAVGAREFLIAYNVNYNTVYAKLANEVALEIKEAGRNKKNEKGKFVRDDNGVPIKVPGKFKCVKAIGWYVDTYKLAQVSINLTNYKISPLHEVYEECRKQGERFGIIATGSEVVGLIPKEPLIQAGLYYLKKQNKSTGVPEEELINVAVRSMGLDSVAPFDPKKKIIDYIFKEEGPLAKMTVDDFVKEVSVESPAPGGGSVAALSGSLGAALASMVANLTTGKLKFKKVEQSMIETANKAQLLRASLTKAIDDDTDAFNSVLAAMRLPKSTEEEKSFRDEQIEIGYKSAAEVPLQTVKYCMEVLPLALYVAEKGNKNSASDAAVAALCADAGVKGAILNVKINLGNINDQDFVDKLRESLQDYWNKSTKMTNEIVQIVEKRI